MTTDKHILILPRWYPNKTDVQLGGFIQQQAILLKDDYNVHVIYVQAIADQKKEFEIVSNSKNGIDEQIVYFKQDKGPFKKIINARRYKKAQKMAFKAGGYRPELCHIHVPYRSALLALGLKKQGIPFVVTEHWSGHLTGDYHKKNASDKKMYKYVLNQSSGISTVSNFLQHKFKQNTGFDSEVIPNLIKLPQLKTEAEKDTIEIFSVSDLDDKTKNITSLLWAFSHAQERIPQLRLSIVGDGPDRALVEDMIKEYELDGYVQLLGRMPQEEVLNLFGKYDFYVCNSRFETFGMAVAEAISAGLPVVSTKCGGPQEFVNDSNGILIDKIDDLDLLFDAIMKMSTEYKNYDSAAMSKEIQSRFGSDIIKSKILEFYSNAINTTN